MTGTFLSVAVGIGRFDGRFIVSGFLYQTFNGRALRRLDCCFDIFCDLVKVKNSPLK